MVVFAIHQHESAMNVHVSHQPEPPLPPPSSPHPSGLSQSTSFGCPASCIEFALVIYFTCGNKCVSMLFSQIIPPSPSPTEFKSSLHLCLFCCPVYRVVVTIFIVQLSHPYTTTGKTIVLTIWTFVGSEVSTF